MARARVGILALQGDFEKHQDKIKACGGESLQVKHAHQLKLVDALIIPGGESSTFLRLLDNSENLEQALVEFGSSGKPMLCTCAGLILAARKVYSPEQRSLGILDVEVERNAYGRQLQSFIHDFELPVDTAKILNSTQMTGVFIRAPKIVGMSEKIEVLLRHGDDPVLVKQGNILGASFHPELAELDTQLHSFLVKRALD